MLQVRITALVLIQAIAGLCLIETPSYAAGEPKKPTGYPRHVLIIRHAEKTGDKDDIHLSKQGQERSAILDRLFVVSKERPDPFPTPDFIFAAAPHMDSQRPLDTVSPLAKGLKLNVDNKYNNKLPPKEIDEKAPKIIGMAELRDELFGTAKYHGKTVLIAWRHSTMVELATALGAKNIPKKWGDDVFDRVWQITYDKEGKAAFRDRPQRLLPKDSEK